MSEVEPVAILNVEVRDSTGRVVAAATSMDWAVQLAAGYFAGTAIAVEVYDSGERKAFVGIMETVEVTEPVELQAQADMVDPALVRFEVSELPGTVTLDHGDDTQQSIPNDGSYEHSYETSGTYHVTVRDAQAILAEAYVSLTVPETPVPEPPPAVETPAPPIEPLPEEQ